MNLVNVASTTDTQEAIKAVATGEKPVVEAEVVEPVVEKSEVEAKAATEKNGESDTSKKSDDSEPKPSQSNLEKRFSKLTKRNAEKDRTIENLRAENAALRVSKPSAAEPEPKPAPVAQASEGRPKQDDFNSHEEWAEALAEWTVDKKLAAKEIEKKVVETKTERQKLADAYNEQSKVFAKENPDFSQIIDDCEVELSKTVGDAILETGPKLAYALAKEPEEFKRICALPPVAAARELGKFEARVFTSDDVVEEKPKAKPKPAPPSAVGSRTSGTKDPGEMTFKEYKKWWADTHPNGG